MSSLNPPKKGHFKVRCVYTPRFHTACMCVCVHMHTCTQSIIFLCTIVRNQVSHYKQTALTLAVKFKRTKTLINPSSHVPALTSPKIRSTRLHSSDLAVFVSKLSQTLPWNMHCSMWQQHLREV